MVSINKIPATRLNPNCTERIDHVVRKPDNRTMQELKATISYYADNNSDVKKYADEINNLPQKHIGTIADIIELSKHSQLFAADVDLNTKQNDTSILSKLIKHMVLASKYNPNGLKLVDSIINNTDALTSKFSLYMMSEGVILDNSYAEQMDAVSDVVPDIAQKTLTGHDVFDFSERKSFIKQIKTLVTENISPEKIAMFYKKIMQFRRYMGSIDEALERYVKSDTPSNVVEQNIAVLDEIIPNRQSLYENFDVISFLTRNTNIK